MYFLSNEEKEKFLENNGERETAVTRQGVNDAETVILKERKDMTTAEYPGKATGKPKTMFEKMFNTIGERLSILESSDTEQNGVDEEDDEDDPELGKLSDDDKPG
jgi:hypothetical protein